MGIPWVKKNWQIVPRGEDSGEKIFGVDPWEFAPWVTFFRLPGYETISHDQNRNWTFLF